ncbi:hypothetical protein GCM10011415_05250 [Salipiger pallidus]|uniref:Malonate transporter n=1 Tax=Salipiger pallidus TaxID=1775170 RepID=A0A8J2ZH47_9RHOB|nr:AEC family transporter [Salipiger pallidus]GGG61998.1 hypothetical protein GCM10011415_05250 [Salipiger pallidus]
MLTVLTHDILPVFAILALGFVLGRGGVIARAEAAAANRISFMVMQPALIFPTVAAAPLDLFEWGGLGLYFACEIAVFAVAFGIFRRMMGRETGEAWLLSMAVVFVNTLLYVWPVSVMIYGDGEAATLPVMAIAVFDTAVTFAIFIIGTELIMRPSTSIGPVLRRIAVNPVLLSIVLGLGVNLFGLSLPVPLLEALQFAGKTAAPLTLFALGVILSAGSLVPSAPVAVAAGMKLMAFPALVGLALQLGEVGGQWQEQVTLASAGPSGSMAFALAMLYGVRTDAVAPVIVWTSVLSLVSLAVLA